MAHIDGVGGAGAATQAPTHDPAAAGSTGDQASGTATTAAATTVTAARPASAADIDAAADRIEAAGSADARATQLAHELAPLDDTARAALMGELADRENLEHGIPSDWFGARALNDAASAGVLSQSEQRVIAESLALAYNQGRMDAFEVMGFVTADDPWGQYVDNVNAVNDFLRAGGGPAMDRFVQDYAAERLNFLLDTPATSFTAPDLERTVHLLAGAGSAQITADVLAGLSATQRQSLYETLPQAPGSWSWGQNDPLMGDIRSWASSDDPLSILIDAVARQPGLGETIYVSGVPYAMGTYAQATTYDALAAEMVRFAGQHESFFFHHDDAIPARAQAMASLLHGHDQFVLDQLTDPRFGQFAPGHSQYDPASLDDVAALGTLARMTMLNPALGWRQTVAQQDLLRYAQSQIDGGPGLDAAVSPTGRTAMLLLAVQDGVRQSYGSLEHDRAAQTQVVGFFTDLLVGQAAKAGGALIPGGALATAVGGAVIDAASKEGKAALREAVTDLLFGAYDTGDQDAVQAVVNDLVGQFVQGLPDAQEALIGTFMTAMGEALDDRRG